MSAAILERLRKEAEDLTAEERLSLAEHLWATLPADASVEQAWLEEAARRSRDIDDGKARLKPWAQVQSELKGRLENRNH
jgi:putative addiction module component (TIGR02574 family)